MKELKMNLTNCYGIQNMDFSVDYSNNNVAVIYAPNGTMKSSLAKTLRDVHDGKEPEEKIFGRPSNYKFSDDKRDYYEDSNMLNKMYEELNESEK